MASTAQAPWRLTWACPGVAGEGVAHSPTSPFPPNSRQQGSGRPLEQRAPWGRARLPPAAEPVDEATAEGNRAFRI